MDIEMENENIEINSEGEMEEEETACVENPPYVEEQPSYPPPPAISGLEVVAAPQNEGEDEETSPTLWSEEAGTRNQVELNEGPVTVVGRGVGRERSPSVVARQRRRGGEERARTTKFEAVTGSTLLWAKSVREP
ncbi:hypothetical protein AWZ03_014786 [Drosophila navojoa]|uniref:Uncharacterized protein n=1 Tax=Drosophila navojoa TaxID=7232 RepID=A0A484AT48_DRONA|nr:hypothetical protein AWZ03_014786 [Drosophila navojoa]